MLKLKHFILRCSHLSADLVLRHLGETGNKAGLAKYCLNLQYLVSWTRLSTHLTSCLAISNNSNKNNMVTSTHYLSSPPVLPCPRESPPPPCPNHSQSWRSPGCTYIWSIGLQQLQTPLRWYAERGFKGCIHIAYLIKFRREILCHNLSKFLSASLPNKCFWKWKIIMSHNLGALKFWVELWLVWILSMKHCIDYESREVNFIILVLLVRRVFYQAKECSG